MKTNELFNLVSGLSGVQRFSMLKMVHKETVLEHTGMMACFAFTLGTRLNLCKPGYEFNMGLLMSKATVHDWDEYLTGDIARPTKYFSTTLRNELMALEIQAIDHLADMLYLQPHLVDLHRAAKESAEGSLVWLCDIACAIHRCWEEVLVFNNMHFTLPASRLRRVLHTVVKNLELGQMSPAQWRIVDGFVLDLNNILNKIVQRANGELKELASAD